MDRLHLMNEEELMEELERVEDELSKLDSVHSGFLLHMFEQRKRQILVLLKEDI